MDRRDLLYSLLGAAAAPATTVADVLTRRRMRRTEFLWGAAISAHPSEGNNVNSDMWLNEHVPGTLFREASGDACDSFNRYAEDVRLTASLGFNCYRMGVEWSRIEPAPGQFSMAALDHYARVLEECRAHNLQPMITFSHFTTPRWFAARGGFEANGAPELFARYCRTAARHFGTLVASATTFNQINAPRLIPVLAPRFEKARPQIDRMLAASAAACGSDRFSSWIFSPAERIETPTRIAHTLAYAAITAETDYPVGISLLMQELQPIEGAEGKAAELNRLLYDQWMAPEVPADFVGVQAFTRILIGPAGPLSVPVGAPTTDAGIEYYPQALGAMVRYAARKSGKPIVITESGIATADDTRRVAFIDSTLPEVHACVAKGIDLRGYVHASLLDTFEWTHGYSQRSGLVAVDRTTFKRTPKPSAFHLGRLARPNIA